MAVNHKLTAGCGAIMLTVYAVQSGILAPKSIEYI